MLVSLAIDAYSTSRYRGFLGYLSKGGRHIRKAVVMRGEAQEQILGHQSLVTAAKPMVRDKPELRYTVEDVLYKGLGNIRGGTYMHLHIW